MKNQKNSNDQIIINLEEMNQNEIQDLMNNLNSKKEELKNQRKEIERDLMKKENLDIFQMIDESGKIQDLNIGYYIRSFINSNSPRFLKDKGFDEGIILSFLNNSEGKWIKIKRSSGKILYRKMNRIYFQSEFPPKEFLKEIEDLKKSKDSENIENSESKSKSKKS